MTEPSHREDPVAAVELTLDKTEVNPSPGIRATHCRGRAVAPGPQFLKVCFSTPVTFANDLLGRTPAGCWPDLLAVSRRPKPAVAVITNRDPPDEPPGWLSDDQISDPRCQRGHVEWFGEYVHASIEVTVAEYRVLGVAGDKQYLQVRS